MYIPAISVIIPVKDSQLWLHRCLNSVINQTLKDIEIIIIDDNSHDMSRHILNMYCIYDNRINVIYKNNTIGTSRARNIGINIANGEFIAFMDSDDIYPNNNVLNVLYKKAIENKMYICGGSLAYIDKNENFLVRQLDRYQKFQHEGIFTYQEYQYDGGFYRFLYKNSFIKKNSLYFKDDFRMEDCLFFVQAMHAAKYFYAIPDYTYFYRKNHKHKAFDKKFICQSLECRNEIIKFAKRFNYIKLYNQQKGGVKNDIRTKITIKNISFKAIKMLIILMYNLYFKH